MRGWYSVTWYINCLSGFISLSWRSKTFGHLFYPEALFNIISKMTIKINSLAHREGELTFTKDVPCATKGAMDFSCLLFLLFLRTLKGGCYDPYFTHKCKKTYGWWKPYKRGTLWKLNLWRYMCVGGWVKRGLLFSKRNRHPCHGMGRDRRSSGNFWKQLPLAQ